MSPATAFDLPERSLPMSARSSSPSRRERPENVAGGNVSGRRQGPKVILAVVGVLMVIAVIAGAAIYQDQIAPFQRPVVVVDKTAVPMSYFLRRAHLSDADPMSVLHTLAKEQLVNRLAPLPPYNIALSEDDVDQFLHEIARGQGESLSKADFQEWLRQQVNETGLSTAEFRDLARTNMLTQRLTALLGERIPTVAEQMRLQVIVTGGLDEARRFRSRLVAGETSQNSAATSRRSRAAPVIPAGFPAPRLRPPSPKRHSKPSRLARRARRCRSTTGISPSSTFWSGRRPERSTKQPCNSFGLRRWRTGSRGSRSATTCSSEA